MRNLTALVGLVLAASLVSAEDPPKPTTKECRAELKQWVPMFKAVYADPACTGDSTSSCPFAPPIRTLNAGQLSDIAFRAEACVKVDTQHRYLYQRVATRAENVVVMRTANFFNTTNQMERYAEWERSQQQTPSPTEKWGSDEQPTVANNR